MCDASHVRVHPLCGARPPNENELTATHGLSIARLPWYVRYNRNLTITNNELSFIGDGAMASWGDTSAALNENGTLAVPGGYKVGPDGRCVRVVQGSPSACCRDATSHDRNHRDHRSCSST